MSTKPVVLDNLFRNEEANKTFIKYLEDPENSSGTPIVVSGKVVGVAFTTEVARANLEQKLIQQVGRDPDFLDRLKKSLESPLVPDEED